jgi:hypothetical protein
MTMKRLSTSLVSAIGIAVFSLVPPAHAEDAPPVDASPDCWTYVDDGGMVVDGDGGVDGSEGYEGDPGIYVDPVPEDGGVVEGDDGGTVVEEVPVDEEYVEEVPVEEEYVEEPPAEAYPTTDEPVCYEAVPVEPCDTCEVHATDGYEETSGAPVAAESGPVTVPVEPTSATIDDVTPDTGAAPAPAAPAAETPAEAAPAVDAPAADEPVTVAAPAVPRAAVAEVEVEAISEEVPAIQSSTHDDAPGRAPWLVTIALVLAGAAAVGGWLRFRTR